MSDIPYKLAGGAAVRHVFARCDVCGDGPAIVAEAETQHEDTVRVCRACVRALADVLRGEVIWQTAFPDLETAGSQDDSRSQRTPSTD